MGEKCRRTAQMIHDVTQIEDFGECFHCALLRCEGGGCSTEGHALLRREGGFVGGGWPDRG